MLYSRDIGCVLPRPLRSPCLTNDFRRSLAVCIVGRPVIAKLTHLVLVYRLPQLSEELRRGALAGAVHHVEDYDMGKPSSSVNAA